MHIWFLELKTESLFVCFFNNYSAFFDSYTPVRPHFSFLFYLSHCRELSLCRKAAAEVWCCIMSPETAKCSTKRRVTFKVAVTFKVLPAYVKGRNGMKHEALKYPVSVLLPCESCSVGERHITLSKSFTSLSGTDRLCRRLSVFKII